MRKIYKYAMIKYAKSPSTWIIILFTLILVVMLGGYLPWSMVKYKNNQSDINKYITNSIVITTMITGFLSIFTSVFTGFKSATLFKDEVEDGTFLVMLSKPIERSGILLGKWLALQTFILFYTLIVASTLAISLAAFDTYKDINYNFDLELFSSVRSKAWIILLIVWMILYVTSLIFSSLSTLISTFLSVGATIGISITLAVIVPITQLIGRFTANDEYETISQTNNKFFKKWTDDKNISKQLDEIFGKDSKALKEKIKGVISGSVNSFIEDPSSLYNVALTTNEKNSFNNLWPLDLNFQISTLSDFAGDQLIDSDISSEFRNSMKKYGKVVNSKIEKNGNLNLIDKTNDWTPIYQTLETNFNKFKDIRVLLLPWFIKEITGEGGSMNKIFELWKNIWADSEKEDKNQYEKNVEVYKTILPSFDNELTKELFDKMIENILLYDANPEMFFGEENENKLLALSYSINKLSWWTLQTFATTREGNALNPTEKESEWSNSMSLLISKLIRPLAWVNGVYVDDYIKSNFNDKFIEANYAPEKDVNHLITKNKQYYPKSKSDIFRAVISNVQALDPNETVASLKFLSDNNIKLYKAKSVEYVQKTTILWIYIGIAFGLLPITYFVIRKQDFR